VGPGSSKINGIKKHFGVILAHAQTPAVIFSTSFTTGQQWCLLLPVYCSNLFWDTSSLWIASCLPIIGRQCQWFNSTATGSKSDIYCFVWIVTVIFTRGWCKNPDRLLAILSQNCQLFHMLNVRNMLAFNEVTSFDVTFINFRFQFPFLCLWFWVSHTVYGRLIWLFLSWMHIKIWYYRPTYHSHSSLSD